MVDKGKALVALIGLVTAGAAIASVAKAKSKGGGQSLSGTVTYAGGGYSDVGWSSPGWPVVNAQLNAVVLASDPQGNVFLETIVAGVERVSGAISLKKGVAYPFTLEYNNGVATATINGESLGTLPAPSQSLPYFTEGATVS